MPCICRVDRYPRFATLRVHGSEAQRLAVLNEINTRAATGEIFIVLANYESLEVTNGIPVASEAKA